MADDQPQTARPAFPLTPEQFAQMVDRSPRIIQYEITKGFIPVSYPGKRARLELFAAIKGHCAYLDHLTFEATKKAAGNEVSRARAREIEQRIAQRDKTLISTEESFALIDLVLGTYRGALDGLPATFTRDMAERRRLEGLLDVTYARANAQLEQGLARIRAGGSPDEAPADDDARPVGRRKSKISRKRRKARTKRPAPDAVHDTDRAGDSERPA